MTGLYRKFALRLAPMLAELDWKFDRPEDCPPDRAAQVHSKIDRLRDQLGAKGDQQDLEIAFVQEQLWHQQKYGEAYRSGTSPTPSPKV
jgi:hypothetical protein